MEAHFNVSSPDHSVQNGEFENVSDSEPFECAYSDVVKLANKTFNGKSNCYVSIFIWCCLYSLLRSVEMESGVSGVVILMV